MKNKSQLEKYVKTHAKKALNFYMSDRTGGDNISSVDFYAALNSRFSIIPHHKEEREVKLKQIKSSVKLSIVDNIDRRSVILSKRAGDERDGLVFKKINPRNLNPNVRPNSYDWSAEEFNRKIVDRMVAAEEDIESEKIQIEEINKKIDQEGKRLSEENKNI